MHLLSAARSRILFLLHVSLISMKLGGGGAWGDEGRSLFVQSPLTLLAENNDEPALLSHACPVHSHASPIELVKDKAGEGLSWHSGTEEHELRLDVTHQTFASSLPHPNWANWLHCRS